MSQDKVPLSHIFKDLLALPNLGTILSHETIYLEVGNWLVLILLGSETPLDPAQLGRPRRRINQASPDEPYAWLVQSGVKDPAESRRCSTQPFCTVVRDRQSYFPVESRVIVSLHY